MLGISKFLSQRFGLGCLALAVLVFPGVASAGNFKVVHAFAGGTDGSGPVAGLVADRQGNIYGTVENGGAGAPGRHCGKGCGNTFSIDRSGHKRTIFSFTGKDGAYPDSVLFIYKHKFYGTTSQGGGFRCGHGTCGTVYELTRGGKETLLHIFCRESHCADGNEPSGGVIADKAGNFYGVTYFGGTTKCPYHFPGCGVVFKISPDRTETVLYSFCSQPNCADGRFPSGGLILDGAGNLYGVASAGGANDDGVIFKLAADGTETVLYSFCSQSGCADGEYPNGPLIMDKTGNLYGTTGAGGGSSCDGYGCGVVFKLAPDGAETVLHAFAGGGDGANPVAGVVADKAGNLYGTTSEGGGQTGCHISSGCGTVFEVAAGGTETILHAFCSSKNCADGDYPQAGLLLLDNKLYGTARDGGLGLKACGVRGGCGTIFRLDP